MLDLFCGRLSIARAFAERGWECICVDLIAPLDIPRECTFYQLDVLSIRDIRGWMAGWDFDFGWASSPCEKFSVHGMRHFHPNPPYPESGIKLFNHTRALFEASGVPYVMENVRAAQQFVGNAVNHCGPFYLWGTAVPPLLHQGITKTGRCDVMPGSLMEREIKRGKTRRQARNDYQRGVRKVAGSDAGCAAYAATIPPELAACVADYATRIVAKEVSA
jgi:hypothetical protein